MKILINALGIIDSGGLNVFLRLIEEIKLEKEFKFFIFMNRISLSDKLEAMFRGREVVSFYFIENKSFMHRLFVENILFRKIVKNENINFVYNFSGSGQMFSKVPQLTKIQNLLFYCKKLDKVYIQKKKYLLLFKQILIKRFLLKLMLRKVKYLEVQSAHVKDYLNDFISIEKKVIFIKSDIDIKKGKFSNPKIYNFSKPITLLYIIGPHFDFIHKNIIDFILFAKQLIEEKIKIQIAITLTKEQLNNSNIWDPQLNNYTKFLGYIQGSQNIEKLFKNNTILVSTSIVETIGLHVIEAIQNGVLSIVPNEKYANSVYSSDMNYYKLFDIKSMTEIYRKIVRGEIKNNVKILQKKLMKSENEKNQSFLEIIREIKRIENV